jgi:hypothetical protein
MENISQFTVYSLITKASHLGSLQNKTGIRNAARERYVPFRLTHYKNHNEKNRDSRNILFSVNLIAGRRLDEH